MRFKVSNYAMVHTIKIYSDTFAASKFEGRDKVAITCYDNNSPNHFSK